MHAITRDGGMNFVKSEMPSLFPIFMLIITPGPTTLYLRMEEARRLRASALLALASATRLARI